MAKWKDIGKLSAADEKRREAAFEAAVMAELGKQERPLVPSHPSAPAGSTTPESSITVTVTIGGQTTVFSRLEDVPVEIRQRIVAAWLAGPGR